MQIIMLMQNCVESDPIVSMTLSKKDFHWWKSQTRICGMSVFSNGGGGGGLCQLTGEQLSYCKYKDKACSCSSIPQAQANKP